MGDRCNVYFTDAKVFLYGHWCGYDIAIIVRDALKRGGERWSDWQYLPRVVFAEMTKADPMGLVGYGISHELGDNGRPIIVLNTSTSTIARSRGRGIDASIKNPVGAMPFAQFVELSDEEAREWHLGAKEAANG